jgi:hypothetical protein
LALHRAHHGADAIVAMPVERRVHERSVCRPTGRDSAESAIAVGFGPSGEMLVDQIGDPLAVGSRHNPLLMFDSIRMTERGTTP